MTDEGMSIKSDIVDDDLAMEAEMTDWGILLETKTVDEDLVIEA